MIYNCETWGNGKLDDLEKKYRNALKYMLGVRSSTCNEFSYIELQKYTLKSLVQKRQLKFYRDCMVNKDWSMQRYIIRKGIDVNCPFVNHYITLNSKYNDPEDIVKESLSQIKDTVRKKAADHSRYKAYILMNPLHSRNKFLYSNR